MVSDATAKRMSEENNFAESVRATDGAWDASRFEMLERAGSDGSCDQLQITCTLGDGLDGLKVCAENWESCKQSSEIPVGIVWKGDDESATKEGVNEAGVFGWEN